MHPEDILILVPILFVLSFLGLCLYVGFVYFEAIYAYFTHRPLFVHCYWSRNILSVNEVTVLRQHSTFYMQLSAIRQEYFQHRVIQFLQQYEFIGRDGFKINNEVRIRIAATYVMMTFGWRKYLTPYLERIIVYPAAYRSSKTDDWHKGEYNPGLKTIVFSWDDFELGERHSGDNLHLGIHEFAHLMHYHGTRDNGINKVVFARFMNRMLRDIRHPNNNAALRDSGYFRDYAFTNNEEFFAVILEHFFETPEEFRSYFPQLFGYVQKMLNKRD